MFCPDTCWWEVVLNHISSLLWGHPVEMASAEARSGWELKLFLLYCHNYPHCTVTFLLQTLFQLMCCSLFNKFMIFLFCKTAQQLVPNQVPVSDSMIDWLDSIDSPGLGKHAEFPGSWWLTWKGRNKDCLNFKTQKSTNRKPVEPWWCKAS